MFFTHICFLCLLGAASLMIGARAQASPELVPCDQLRLRDQNEGVYELNEIINAHFMGDRFVNRHLRPDGLEFRFRKTDLKRIPHKSFASTQVHSVWKVEVTTAKPRMSVESDATAQILAGPVGSDAQSQSLAAAGTSVQDESKFYPYFQHFSFVGLVELGPLPPAQCWIEWSGQNEEHPHKWQIFQGLGLTKLDADGSFYTIDDEAQPNFKFQFKPRAAKRRQ